MISSAVEITQFMGWLATGAGDQQSLRSREPQSLCRPSRIRVVGVRRPAKRFAAIRGGCSQYRGWLGGECQFGVRARRRGRSGGTECDAHEERSRRNLLRSDHFGIGHLERDGPPQRISDHHLGDQQQISDRGTQHQHELRRGCSRGS